VLRKSRRLKTVSDIVILFQIDTARKCGNPCKSQEAYLTKLPATGYTTSKMIIKPLIQANCPILKVCKKKTDLLLFFLAILIFFVRIGIEYP